MRLIVFLVLLAAVEFSLLVGLAPSTVMGWSGADPDTVRTYSLVTLAVAHMLIGFWLISLWRYIHNNERATRDFTQYKAMMDLANEILQEKRGELMRELVDLRAAAAEPARLVQENTCLRRALRASRKNVKNLTQRIHISEVEIAELRQLRLHLEDADYDDERYVVLLRETAQLRERIQVTASREEYERLLAEHYELKGRYAALREQAEKPAPNGAQAGSTVTSEVQKAVAGGLPC